LVVALAALASLAVPAAALAHTSEVPVSDPLRSWSPEPTVLVASFLAIALFGGAFRRLRRRGRPDHAGWTHAGPFLLGVLVLALALMSPLDATGDEYLLSAHMLQHVLIGDLAPALLVFGTRGPLTLFLLPAPILRSAAGIRWLRRTVAFLLRPKPAFFAWALALAIWHVPAFYDAALTRPWLHELEHASFLFGGLLVWCQLIDPARRGELDLRGRILFAAALIATAHLFIHPVLLSGRVVYGAYAAQPHRLLGFSPLSDQHWAALVMSAEQILTLGVFLLVSLRPRVARPFVGRAAPASVQGQRRSAPVPHHDT
jgi:cytochrome c oxidase assembly factor CtaG